MCTEHACRSHRWNRGCTFRYGMAHLNSLTSLVITLLRHSSYPSSNFEWRHYSFYAILNKDLIINWTVFQPPPSNAVTHAVRGTADTLFHAALWGTLPAVWGGFPPDAAWVTSGLKSCRLHAERRWCCWRKSTYWNLNDNPCIFPITLIIPAGIHQ